MQLMDSKRPFGRAAVVLAGLLSLTCGWMAIASSPERETVAATASEYDSPVVVTWQVADALIELGMLQVEEYDEHGGAVATLAASGGTGLSVVVVTGMEGDVIAQVPRGGGIVQDPGQQWPPNWNYQGCTGPMSGGTFTCHYVQIWSASEKIPCPNGGVRVISYEYRRSCSLTKDACSACPATPPPGADGCGAAPPNNWATCPAGSNIKKRQLNDSGCP